ncbi:MAG: glycosyl transferase family 2, partial [bacterium]
MQEIGNVDLLVGIASYNSAQTIDTVIRAANIALRESLSPARSLIVISEGGSLEETNSAIELARDPFVPILLSPYPVDHAGLLSLPYHGIPGRREALWTILQIAERLQAKACVILDSRLQSMTPQWIESLITPIWKLEFDYASPIYARHKYEGGLVNCIVYPLVRGLYGKDIRHPMGGEFAMSARLISHYLSSQEAWRNPDALPEIDIWMACSTIVGDYAICQAYVGPRLYESPSADLSSIICQVVGSLFHLAESYQGVWQKGLPESHPPIFGTSIPQPSNPPPVDPHPMIQAFHRGLRDLLPLWEQALSPETLQDLYPLGGLTASDFRFPMDLWVRVIYDMLLAYHYRIFYWRHLLKSLTPLYLGRMASLIIETEK